MIQKFHDVPESHTFRTAIFPGSFNPFTVGHLSVLERGLLIFDRIIVAVGINAAKQSDNDVDSRLTEIRNIVSEFSGRVDVVSYSGLTVDEAEKHGARFILRGVRSVADFEYERNMADINRRISGIETVLLYSLPEHSCVSSSVVRELQGYGRNVDNLLP